MATRWVGGAQALVRHIERMAEAMWESLHTLWNRKVGLIASIVLLVVGLSYIFRLVVGGWVQDVLEWVFWVALVALAIYILFLPYGHFMINRRRAKLSRE